MNAIEKRVAVILSKSDAEDREDFEAKVNWYYRKACRLKVKMLTRPFLIAAPRGIQARDARPDDGQSQRGKETRAELMVIRGGHSAGREHPGASEVPA